jgi:hypothetical protein
MRNLSLILFFFLFLFNNVRSQSPWIEINMGSTEDPMFRQGPVGIGTFGIPDAPDWPSFPLHIVGFQSSLEDLPNAPRIQLDHSYLTDGGSQQNGNNGQNGPNSSFGSAGRHFISWGVENKSGILNFIRGTAVMARIGSTKMTLGSSQQTCDLQVFGDMIFGNPVGGDKVDLYADTYFQGDANFMQQVNFTDKLVIGDAYSGASNFRLSVDGNILCQEVTVETVQEWNDHVFEEGYNLRSLEELSDFILENGHLPEVPSAKSLKKDGYNLVEMDALLLKKIEELTLYLLEQK